jgi:hypothetical protein
MPVMLQQTPKNFKDFRPIQFSEGIGGGLWAKLAKSRQSRA